MESDLANLSLDEIRRLAIERLSQMKVSIVLCCRGDDLQVSRAARSGLRRSRTKTMIQSSSLTDPSNMSKSREERRQSI